MTVLCLFNTTLFMDETPISRIYLESLTTSELVAMADKLGVDIPYGLDRIFIVEELLDIVLEDNEENNSTEMDLLDSGLVESVPLPKQYNITFLEVIVRDPLWAFVFWEIKAQDKEELEKAQNFEGYFLKVLPCVAAAETNRNEAEGVFRVPVSPNDTAWYLGFTPEMKDGVSRNIQPQYKVELCAVIKGEETMLAVSLPFCLPGLHEVSQGRSANVNLLNSLSGYSDFHIIRSSERLLRNKRNVETRNAGAPNRSFGDANG